METARECAFCQHEALEVILTETPNFLVLADHAPLVAGHVLIVPREHLACYGALPVALEAEFLALKGRVAAFLRAAYAKATFFEHGVFHQTVFHAHLHAFPFGAVSLPFHVMNEARPAHGLTDVRAWYAKHGHYFYLEPPCGRADEGTQSGESNDLAMLFPARESVYFPTLMALRQASTSAASWAPAPRRRLGGREKMERVAAAWREFERGAHVETDSMAGQ